MDHLLKKFSDIEDDTDRANARDTYFSLVQGCVGTIARNDLQSLICEGYLNKPQYNFD